MDPNAAVTEMLRIANRLMDDSLITRLDEAERLAELAIALDGWIRSGGFLPDAWEGVERRLLRLELDAIDLRAAAIRAMLYAAPEPECQCGTPGIVQCDMHGPTE
jgi:hypothetical protein